MKLRYHEFIVSDGTVIDIPDYGILDPPYLIIRSTPNKMTRSVGWFEIVERYGESTHGP